jgi:hypothetical protein
MAKTPQQVNELRTESGDALYDDTNDALIVSGVAAHDAAAAGNPVLMGAEADETSTDNVDEGDVGKLRMTLARLLKTETSFGEPKELFEDELPDDSNKTCGPASGKVWHVHSIYLQIATSPDVGNREFSVLVRYTADTVAAFHCAFRQAADSGSKIIHFIAQGVNWDTSFVGSQAPTANVPIPIIMLNDAMTLNIKDNTGGTGVAASADDMSVHVWGVEVNE